PPFFSPPAPRGFPPVFFFPFWAGPAGPRGSGQRPGGGGERRGAGRGAGGARGGSALRPPPPRHLASPPPALSLPHAPRLRRFRGGGLARNEPERVGGLAIEGLQDGARFGRRRQGKPRLLQFRLRRRGDRHPFERRALSHGCRF